jgi:L-ascorbate metabolism protein UlaG (beta-lactamase superfamily)
MNGRQVAMTAIEAAELAAVLRPDVAIPHSRRRTARA